MAASTSPSAATAATAATAAKPAKPKESDLEITARLRLEVERAVQRGLKSMELLSAPPAAVGGTPKTVLHRRGTLELVHYHAQSDEVYRVPILIVMAPTNKGFILDLTPGQSLIEFLLQRGYDVYMIDWHAPTADESHLQIENYVLDFIPDCIRRVQEDSGEEDLTLIGYCAGGMLSTVYQATHPDGPVKNLVCFTTPINFSEMKLFRDMSDSATFDVDRFVDRVGVIPADFVSAGFDALRPASRLAGQIRLWDNLWNDEFVTAFRRMERWGNETLPLPGGYFRQTIKELMRKNALYEGTLSVGGKPVKIENIKVPLLHFIAQYDHIVPPAAAHPLVARAGSKDKTEIILPGGHVSLAAGPNAIKRMWPALNSWLEGRSL